MQHVQACRRDSSLGLDGEHSRRAAHRTRGPCRPAVLSWRRPRAQAPPCSRRASLQASQVASRFCGEQAFWLRAGKRTQTRAADMWGACASGAERLLSYWQRTSSEAGAPFIGSDTQNCSFSRWQTSAMGSQSGSSSSAAHLRQVDAGPEPAVHAAPASLQPCSRGSCAMACLRHHA